MDLPFEFKKKLDFSHGKKFQKEILQLFGSSVHHTLATPSGSFFLLAAFRHFTFRLDESSAAFALASCLGGAPAGFHVQFQSEDIFDSKWPINLWDFMFMPFEGSLVNILMSIFIFGVMVRQIGKEKRGYGNWNKHKEWTEVMSWRNVDGP